MIKFKKGKLFLILINIFISFFLFELISLLFFRNYVKRIYSGYLNRSYAFGRGYPRNYFYADTKKGFDIKKNSEKLLARRPMNLKEYPVWGNSIGCFDNDIPKKEKYYVYLSGDSITWGYAPYDKKFGTLLENKLNKNVAACGVSNTGQIHQYLKYKLKYVSRWNSPCLPCQRYFRN